MGTKWPGKQNLNGRRKSMRGGGASLSVGPRPNGAARQGSGSTEEERAHRARRPWPCARPARAAASPALGPVRAHSLGAAARRGQRSDVPLPTNGRAASSPACSVTGSPLEARGRRRGRRALRRLLARASRDRTRRPGGGKAGAPIRTVWLCREEAPRGRTGAGAGAASEPRYGWRRRKKTS